MRQHAIPQNVLDVQFKLFERFTIKQFVWIAGGLGLAGILINWTSEHVLPAQLSIPAAIMSGGIGCFMGMVPINGQDADTFLRNYFMAINAPTQRVWLSKEMKQERNKPAVKPTEDGRLVASDQSTKKKIIGAGEDTSIDDIQKNIDEATKFEKEQEATIGNIDNLNTTSFAEQPAAPLDENHIFITEDNIGNYQFTIEGQDDLPGNINVWLCTKDYRPITNVTTYLKSKDGRILYANKTGPNGYFLSNKHWDEGSYVLSFKHSKFVFPDVEIALTKKIADSKNPIKISTLTNG